MGPTATGKTALAVELVQQLPFEIVSVDSAMVYRGMDIGTGKPGPEVLARAPHRLIDIRDPLEPYSAGQFVRDARREIHEIDARGRIPLLVGGTGLYFRALRRGLSQLPRGDGGVRRRLAAEAASRGWPALHRRLVEVDEASARRINANDAQRIQRALEIRELTGRPMTEILREEPVRSLGRPVVALVLEPADRGRLYQVIAKRFHGMLQQGLLDEVAALRARGDLHAGLPSMRCVGYRQAWEHLQGGIDQAAMTTRAVAATRHLAKRQLTWLRTETDVLRFDSQDESTPRQVLNHLSALLS